jgi:Cu-Zn family superoxide dismutase
MRHVRGVAFAVGLGLFPAGVCLAEQGRAVLAGTSQEVPVAGTVDFQETPEGLRVIANISTAPPGVHGFHIHEFGSCEDSGKAAGNHYNPLNTSHGDLEKQGVEQAHAGDLGNLAVDATGRGSREHTYGELALVRSPYTVAGRSVILHANPDDFSQPAGNAGGRIGCGVIVIVPTTTE